MNLNIPSPQSMSQRGHTSTTAAGDISHLTSCIFCQLVMLQLLCHPKGNRGPGLEDPLLVQYSIRPMLNILAYQEKGGSGKNRVCVEVGPTSINVASTRLFEERIFEQRADDKGEQGLGRSEGTMPVPQSRGYKGPGTVTGSAGVWGG